MVEIGIIPIEIALILLVAFVLAAVAERTGQPTIMAYIVTGLILGPVFLNVAEGSEAVDLISELGLAMLLFLVGLEMKFDAFRSILSEVTKMAAGQIAIQQTLAFLVAYMLGFGLLESFILSLCTIFGATPIVVKMLTDKREQTTEAGRIDIGTLILQDIYLVIVLAFLTAGEISGAGEIGSTLGRIVLVASAIGGLSYVAAVMLEKKIMGDVTDNKHVFFLQVVAWAFLFIALSDYLGVSKELGGFLAGLSLGQLPYSTEITEKVRPLTNFFIVIFFAGIGLHLDAGELFIYWKEALIAIAILSPAAFFVMYKLIESQGFGPETRFKGSINLVMVSEFSLVAGAIAVENGFITAGMLGYLGLMKLITNGYSTYLIKYNDRLYRYFKPYLAGEDEEDGSDHREGHAVVTGSSELDEVVRPVIDEKFDEVVFIEDDPHEMQRLKQEGESFVFGDPRHPKIREEADIESSGAVISLEMDFELDRYLAETLKVPFIALTNSAVEAERLREAGADEVINDEEALAEILEEEIEVCLND